MQCLLALLALAAPRVVIVLLVVFGDYIGMAFQTRLWPFLGFLFLPVTTLAYAWAVHTYGGLEGLGIAVFVVAILLDFGLLRSSKRGRAEPSRR